ASRLDSPTAAGFEGGTTMRFTIGMVANDSTLPLLDIALEAEARDFYSISIGEHSHMPVDTKHRYVNRDAGPDLYKRFYDPFIGLATVASRTKKIRLGTSVCLIAEHNPIHLAKTVATLDHLSNGRVILGAGYGWNAPEMVNNRIADPARVREV